MRLKKALWILFILGAATTASAFVWLPAPLSIVRNDLQRRDPGFDLAGTAEFRWGSGSLRVRELRLDYEGVELAAADAMQIRLDLRPWRSRRAPAARVAVTGLRAELDAARLALLQKLRNADAAGLTFELELVASQIGWTQPDGRRLELAGIDGRVVSQIGSDRRLVASAAGQARLVQPIAASLDLRLRVGPDPGAWELSADLSAAELPSAAALGLTAAGLEWKNARVQGSVHLQPDLWRVDLTASAENLRHRDLALPLSLERIHLTGDARRALRAEIAAHTPHAGLNADLFLTRSTQPAEAAAWDGWSYDAQGRIDGLLLDDNLRTRLTSLLPEAAEILDNLGLSGAAAGRLRVTGNLAAGAPPPHVLVAVPFAGIGFRYQGFRDKATGERFAYPEPVALRSGNLVVADSLLLLHGEGQLSEAESDPQETPGLPPHILAAGSVQIQAESALVDLDIHALRYPVGPLLGRRLAANPALKGLWDELGSPRGGRADALVRLRSAGPLIQVFVDAHATNLRASPPQLGEAVQADSVEFHFSNGDLSIGGNFSAAGIQVRAQTRSRRSSAGPHATEWTGVAEGSGLPKLNPAAPWVTTIGLPPEILAAGWGGEATWQAGLRLPLTGDGLEAGRLSLTIGVALAAAQVRLPSRGLELSELSASAGLAVGAGGYALMAENGQAIWSEAPMRFGARLFGNDLTQLQGIVSMTLANARISSEQSQRLLKILDAEVWGQRKRLEGRISANLEIPLDNPTEARARIDLAPLVLEATPPRRAARQEIARFELDGRMIYSGGELQSDHLSLTGPEVELLLQDCSGEAGPAGLRLEGRVLSALGMQLRPPLGLIAPQSVLDALDQIGIDGRIAPRDLRFSVDWKAGELPLVSAEGTLELSRFHVSGPPPVEDGAGILLCENFTYRGPEDFGGRFRLDEGSAVVAGIGVSGARAEIQITSQRVVVTSFAADALAGRIATDWIDEEGASRHGSFALGLAGQAEVRAEFRFDNFLLERMGEELGFRGPLAGTLNGEINLRSPDPSPVNYRGSVRMDIIDGVLGTVPVLAQIWRVVGVESPTFRAGRLRLTMLGEGRILVDELSLSHPLLEVTGERMMTIDTYLNLKVTVRTLGFLGRLPLVRDVLDWFVEQDVYGPAATPRLRQRGLGKIFVGDPEHIPFPLWVPKVPRPDWRRSPALPADT